jgi:hypothetical protein
MWVVIEVGSGPREILSGRIFVRAPNKMGRIFADIMRPSVLPTVVFEDGAIAVRISAYADMWGCGFYSR